MVNNQTFNVWLDASTRGSNLVQCWFVQRVVTDLRRAQSLTFQFCQICKRRSHISLPLSSPSPLLPLLPLPPDVSLHLNSPESFLHIKRFPTSAHCVVLSCQTRLFFSFVSVKIHIDLVGMSSSALRSSVEEFCFWQSFSCYTLVAC